jgi:hypothetical protein
METEENIPTVEKWTCSIRKCWWIAASVVLAVGLAWVVYECSDNEDKCKLVDETCLRVVDQDEANKIHTEFITRTDSKPKVFRAFSLTNCMLQAMDYLWCKTESVPAVRLYPGIDPNNQTRVCIMVGVNSDDVDITDNIFLAEGKYAGFCPRLCDQNSPMVNGAEDELIYVRFGQRIEVDKARQMVSKHIQIEEPLEAANAYKITKQLYDQIKVAQGNLSDYAGLRLYFGIDSSDNKVVLIVPFNSKGVEITSTIFAVDPKGSGLCPRYCDRSSAVVRGLPIPD